MRRYIAATYLAFRECLLPTPRHEMQTEILADLHTCIDNLEARRLELAARAARSEQQAMLHLKQAKKEPTDAGTLRAKQRARLCMQERRRLNIEHDKVVRTAHALQMQVDSIVATDVDNLIVDTMRAYNLNASRLSLPARTDQISRLGDELSDRQSELSAMQEALSTVTQQMDTTTLNGMGTSEDDLMDELEGLLEDDAPPEDLKKMQAAPAVRLPSVPVQRKKPPADDDAALDRLVDSVIADVIQEEEEKKQKNGDALLRRARDPVPLAG